MAKSLQEQLLQNGVAKPKQARKARREKAAGNKAARQQGERPAEEQALKREIAAAETAKRDRDRQLNAEQKEQRERRERDHAVAQIIERNQVPACAAGKDTVTYSYTIGRKIHRIEVGDRERRDLAAGRLGIVRHDQHAVLLPRSAAQRIAERVPERLWLVTPDQETVDPDDPYAAFPVPDDLMW